MAERRMFAKRIVQSAKFLQMPQSSRLLYYDLGMGADDEGVVEAYSIMKLTNANQDDLRVLVTKGFIKVLNEDLVALINDWNTNNLIRKDRFQQSFYHDLLVQFEVESKDLLPVDAKPEEAVNQRLTKEEMLENQQEDRWLTNGKPTVNQRLTQVSIGKDNIYKSLRHNNIDSNDKRLNNNNINIYILGTRENIKLTEGEIKALQKDFGENFEDLIDNVSNKLFSRKGGEEIKNYYQYILAVAKDLGLKTVKQTEAEKEKKGETKRIAMKEAAKREASLGYEVADKYKPFLKEEEIEELNSLAKEVRKRA